eukprot:73039-Pyramimonas_sp.AAC.1
MFRGGANQTRRFVVGMCFNRDRPTIAVNLCGREQTLGCDASCECAGGEPIRACGESSTGSKSPLASSVLTDAAFTAL